MSKTTRAALLFALTLPLTLPLTAHGSDLVLKQRWPLGEAGRWDYLDIDPVRHRLFLARGVRVQVLELPSGKVLGEIPGTAGVHGVAFAQDLKLGFTSNGRSDSVTVFDLDSLAVRQEIKVGASNPDAILYEPSAHKLYTFNGKSANVSVIDALGLKLVETIAVAGKPEFAVSDGAGKVYVNIEDKAQIDVLDVASNKRVAQWPLAGCVEPTGLAIDAARARLFSVCQNRIMHVTDAKTGRQVANLIIGAHPDAAVYDAAGATVYSSNGDGTLSVIRQHDADHYATTETLATAKGARTMAMDHVSGAIYLPVALEKVFTVLVLAP